MNKKHQVDHEIDEGLSRLSKPQKIVLYIELVFRFLFYRISHFRMRSRARVHWLGNTQRPRRLERVFWFMVMFVAMMTFESRQYVIWSIVWGGGASLYVIMKTMLMLKPKPAKA